MRTSELLLQLSPVLLAAAGATVFGALSIFRHQRLGSSGFDLGIFDQQIWGYSKFELIENTVKRQPDLLGDHFHPILILLAPLYWLWDDVRILLGAQSALLASAGVPIFLWGRRNLGIAAASAMQLAFLSFWGLLAGALFDFHELAVAVPIISWALYALLARRDVLFWSMLVLGLLTKEDVSLTFFGMALYAGFAQRRWRLALAAGATSLLAFVAIVALVMPVLAGKAYAYWSYERLGNDPGSVLAMLLRSPWRPLTLLIDNSQKLGTIGYLFGSWLYLPLFSPLLVVAIPSLAERFWSSNENFWSTAHHYSLPIAPILAFAAIDVLVRAERWWPGVGVSGAFGVLLAGVLVTVLGVKPYEILGSYRTSEEAHAARECLQVIEPAASVAASDTVVPHLSHRRAIYPLFARNGEDYLAVDVRTRVGRETRMNVTKAYGIVCSAGGVSVLRRLEVGR